MEQSTRILRTYFQIDLYLKRALKAYFAQYDLSYSQAIVLATLQEHGPLPLTTLAQYIDSANSTLSGIINKLEEMGLVTRERSNLDRRVTHVCLTEAFHSHWPQGTPNMEQHFSCLMKHFPEEDSKELLQALQRLEAYLADETED